MLNDDIDDDETTDVEYVTTPRTDEEEPSEPKQTEVQEPEQEVKKPEVEEKDLAVDGTTKDLLNESFEAMISIHR